MYTVAYSHSTTRSQSFVGEGATVAFKLNKGQLLLSRVSLVAQLVKSLPAMRETWVQSLGQKDPLEKEMATHSQYSCLKNSMDRGAWWATVHGATNRHNE